MPRHRHVASTSHYIYYIWAKFFMVITRYFPPLHWRSLLSSLYWYRQTTTTAAAAQQQLKPIFFLSSLSSHSLIPTILWLKCHRSSVRPFVRSPVRPSDLHFIEDFCAIVSNHFSIETWQTKRFTDPESIGTVVYVYRHSQWFVSIMYQ